MDPYRTKHLELDKVSAQNGLTQRENYLQFGWEPWQLPIYMEATQQSFDTQNGVLISFHLMWAPHAHAHAGTVPHHSAATRAQPQEPSTF